MDAVGHLTYIVLVEVVGDVIRGHIVVAGDAGGELDAGEADNGRTVAGFVDKMGDDIFGRIFLGTLDKVFLIVGGGHAVFDHAGTHLQGGKQVRILVAHKDHPFMYVTFVFYVPRCARTDHNCPYFTTGKIGMSNSKNGTAYPIFGCFAQKTKNKRRVTMQNWHRTIRTGIVPDRQRCYDGRIRKV